MTYEIRTARGMTRRFDCDGNAQDVAEAAYRAIARRPRLLGSRDVEVTYHAEEKRGLVAVGFGRVVAEFTPVKEQP